MKHTYTTILFLLISFIANSQTIYVNGALATNGDGTSWATAFNNLQSAIETANNNNEIWIAKGTYYPSKDKSGNANPADNRTKTFYIDKNLKIYGGFDGVETAISQRNIDNNATILSGDLGIVGDISDNSYLVMFIDGEITNINDIKLDGLNYQFGNKTGNSIYNGLFSGGLMIYKFENSNMLNINKCKFSENFGNGISIFSYGLNLQITNCVFENNTKSGIENLSGGGGPFQNISIENSLFLKNTEAISNNMFTTPYGLLEKILNCVFIENNIAIQNGLSDGGTLNCDVINCTFFKNYNSNSKGTAIRSSGLVHQYPTNVNTNIYNCVFDDLIEGNQEIYGTAFDESSGQVADWGVGISINNCIKSSPTPQPLQWGEIYIHETNTLYSQPLFLNYLNPVGPDNKWGTADDGLQLLSCSPAINSGDNSLLPVDLTTDIKGANRIQLTTVDMGAYESNVTEAASLTSINGSFTASQISKTNYLNDCSNLIATVLSNGGQPISGTTEAKVWLEPNTIIYNSLPIVSRHYEITPISNPSTSTGKITLYFTQAEFDEYNNNPNTTYDLPSSPSDAIGKGILRIIKFAGVSNNGTGLPNTYSNTPIVINPIDNDISWNAVQTRWEVTFDVTGFSGFFVQGVTALPINLLSFYLANEKDKTKLTWQTADETNFSHFEIQKSDDAQKFDNIGIIKGNKEGSYSFLDVNPIIGINYYRLKMVDLDGKFKYSKILAENFKNSSLINISPNPVSDKIKINLSTKHQLIGTQALFVNAVGIVVKQFKISKIIEDVDVSSLPNGLYLVKFEDGSTLKLVKN